MLNLAEFGKNLFFKSVDMQGIGAWLPYVYRQTFTAVRYFRNGRNIPKYKAPEGSMLFYLNVIGYVNLLSIFFVIIVIF